MVVQKLPVTIDARILPRVATVPEAGCWLFLGKLDSSGYGVLHLDKKECRAHRYSWAIANQRPIPEGLIVRHRCDTPSCVNPDHLLLGTKADNMQDCLDRGRFGPANKKACVRGHPFSPENTRIGPDLVRYCRACSCIRSKAYAARKKAAAA